MRRRRGEVYPEKMLPSPRGKPAETEKGRAGRRLPPPRVPAERAPAAGYFNLHEAAAVTRCTKLTLQERARFNLTSRCQVKRATLGTRILPGMGEERTGRYGTESGNTSRTRVSVDEAARALGVTVDAIRKRVQRGTIPHERDESGRVWVLLEAARTMQDRSSTAHGSSGNVRDKGQDDTGHLQRELLEAKEETIAELKDRVAYLERRLERQMEEEHEARRRTDTLLAQLSQANAAMAHQIRELTATPEPRDEPETGAEASGGTEAPEGRAHAQEDVQERSPIGERSNEETARRPWWVRWFGG